MKARARDAWSLDLDLLPRPLGEGWGEGQRLHKYMRLKHQAPPALIPTFSQGEKE